MAKKQFKAESKRLMDLMINSIYTHKEIFLREIISNASDAVDKLCYLSLTDSNVGLNRSDFEIRIEADNDSRTLKIIDNGIGMTEKELEANLGTIAKSGSLQFKKDMDSGDKPEDIDIIGQFGVGFYSAFMVSDDVTVKTKAYGSDEAFEWKSSGTEGYTVSPCDKTDTGTEIIIKIKEDSEDEQYSRFLDEYQLVSLVKKYSDYVRYPIKMEREKRRPKEDAENEFESYTETETLNSMVPIWQRNKNEVTQADYDSFYTEKFFDYEKPLITTHVDAEGVVSYKALMFVPSKASYDYYTKEYKKGLQLYSSGVLIMDICADLLPEHFRFVRGIVDSPDLSLNISRELLQHDRQLKVIATNIERKIKSELQKLLGADREKYEAFYKAFGLQLKYGVVAEYGAHKDTLKDLLLFASSNSDSLTTFAEYAARMKDDQKEIYYATGESAQKISALPQTERVKNKGYEILYFTEEVDEFAIQMMREYMDKPFKSIASSDLDIDTEDEKKEAEQKQEENKDLLSFIKESLGERITSATISHKLVSYPVCLSAGDQMSFEMEKYLNSFNADGEKAKADRILELNPNHAVFAKLQDLYTADQAKAKQYIDILYYQSMLIAGLPIENPAEYSELVFGLM